MYTPKFCSFSCSSFLHHAPRSFHLSFIISWPTHWKNYEISCIFKDEIPDVFIQILLIQILDLGVFTYLFISFWFSRTTEGIRIFHDYSVSHITHNILRITILELLLPILITENNKTKCLCIYTSMNLNFLSELITITYNIFFLLTFIIFLCSANNYLFNAPHKFFC